MKTFKRVLSFWLGLILSLNLLHAQQSDFSDIHVSLESPAKVKAMLEALTLVEPVPFAKLPRNRFNQVVSAGFHSMQNPSWPPLPNNFYSLSVWPLGDGVYVLDDRQVDYAAIQEAELEAAATLNFGGTQMRMMSSSLSSYAYGNPVYLTNLVVTTGPMTASFDIAGGTNAVPYDIVMATNLLTPTSSWNWLGIGYTSNRYSFTSQPSNTAFYRLAKPSTTMTVGWGGDIYAQCDVPFGTNNILMVSGGYGYSLGLLTSGTVVGWGNSSTAGWVPTNLVGNVAMIASAWNHNVALLTNGTVTAWGYNGGGLGWFLTDVPASLTNATVIAAQGLHSLALRKDGTVVAWGYNASGQTNVPAGLTNVTAIAAGGKHSLAVSNGFVVAWGDNTFGQRNVPASLSNVWDVAASDCHSLALKTDGTVVAWGDSAYGEINVPAGLSNVVAIAAGGSFTINDAYMGMALPYSLALKKDGTVVFWGAGAVVRPVQGMSNVIGIGGGLFHGLAIRTGPPTPEVTLEPVDQYKVAGDSVSFTAKGQGLYGVTYQWQTNGVNFTGATNATLTLTNVQAAQQGSYRVIVNDNGGYGSIASFNASLTLVTPPVFIYQSQPTNIVTIYGKHLFFSGTAIAPGTTNGFPISYHWQFNGTNIAGITANAYDYIVNDNSSGSNSLVAQNAAGSASISWQVTVTNAINVTNDLLLIYNTNSQDSTTILNYYLAHRPNVSGANVLGIGYTNPVAPGYYEAITPANLTSQILNPVNSWLTNNPTKRPQYVILFMDLPGRVCLNTARPVSPAGYGALPASSSVSVNFRNISPDWQPYVTHLNMGMTNTVNRTNDCIAYINKLATIGVPISSNNPVLSASVGGYGNTNFVLDNVRFGIACTNGCENYSNSPAISAATNALLSAGVPSSNIQFYDGVVVSNAFIGSSTNSYTTTIHDGVTTTVTNNHLLFHATNANNVAGYVSWGTHGTIAAVETVNGAISWQGNSGWYLMQTIESYNGEQVWLTGAQGTFTYWFCSSAFGGTSYSNTPIGAVTTVDEPNLSGKNDSSIYFGRWVGGKNFGVCAWESVGSGGLLFQATGDPLIVQ